MLIFWQKRKQHKFLTPLMLWLLILYMSSSTYSLKSFPNDRFFKKLFMPNKKIFLIFCCEWCIRLFSNNLSEVTRRLTGNFGLNLRTTLNYMGNVWVLQIRWLQPFPKAFCEVNTNLGTKTFHQTIKNIVFGHFWKILDLNTDVLEPSLLSDIDNWSLLFKMSPKSNWLYAPLE